MLISFRLTNDVENSFVYNFKKKKVKENFICEAKKITILKVLSHQSGSCVQDGHFESGVGDVRSLGRAPLIIPMGSAPQKNVTNQIEIIQI